MPEYTYMCKGCRKEFSVVQRMSDAGLRHRCPECKCISRRIFKPVQLAVFQEFVTSDITGDPIRISSTRQEKDICQRNGCVPATKDDMRGFRKRRIAPQVPLREDYERTRYEMEAPKY